MNRQNNLFQKIEKYILADYRSNGCLSEKFDTYIEKYKEIYEANVNTEKTKLLSLICESLLHVDDKDKLKELIDKYCSVDEIKNLLQQIVVSNNNTLDLIKCHFESNEILILKTLSNVFEFLLNEFGIDENDVYRIHQEGNACVKYVISTYIIEMMKLFYHIVNDDDKNNNNNKGKRKQKTPRHHRQPKPKRQRKGKKDEEMNEEKAVLEDEEKKHNSKEKVSKSIKNQVDDDKSYIYNNNNDNNHNSFFHTGDNNNNNNNNDYDDEKEEEEEEEVEQQQQRQRKNLCHLIEKFIHDLVNWLGKENITKNENEIILYIMTPVTRKY